MFILYINIRNTHKYIKKFIKPAKSIANVDFFIGKNHLNLFKQKYILEINSSKDNNDGVKEKGGQHNVADIDDITCVISFINIEKDDY